MQCALTTCSRRSLYLVLEFDGEACPRAFVTCRSAGHEGDHGHVYKASDHLSVCSTRALPRSLHLTHYPRMVRASVARSLCALSERRRKRVSYPIRSIAGIG